MATDEHFLNDFVKQHGGSPQEGLHKGDHAPWYNQYGDCIEFQTVHHAIVADRIDEYLTIYKSAVDNEPIGFKIKDVQALIKKYGCSGMEIKATVSGHRLLSVTALLLNAFRDLPQTINRLEGYTKALSIQKPDEVDVSEGALV